MTPSYNQGRYIEDTIRSVLTQDYPDVEYIVVDGESTDETVEILRKYESRLSWISEKDGGQADAVNKGFRRAKGEIFGWLNSDDTYLPGAIPKVMQYFQAHPEIDMVYGEGYHIDEKGNIIERYPAESFDFERLSEICFICQPTVFFRARVFEEIGSLDINLQYCPDYDYWIRVAKRFSIGYLNEYLANSRLHEKGKTLSRRVEAHGEILRVVKRHYDKVPARWIRAYSHFFLIEKFMRKIQGVHRDGWAGQSVEIVLDEPHRHWSHLSLQGVVPSQSSPLTLKIMVGDQTHQEIVLDTGKFSVRADIDHETMSNSQKGFKVSMNSSNFFTLPTSFGGKDTRKLSYRVTRLSLISAQGEEQIFYSTATRRLLEIAFPLFFLWKYIFINHCIPRKGMWQDG